MYIFFSLVLFATDINSLILKINFLSTPYKLKNIKNYNVFLNYEKVVQQVLEKKIRILTLKSIFNNRAYINDSWYKVGDILYGEFKIIKISDNYVLLEKQNHFYKLKLKKTNIIKVSK